MKKILFVLLLIIIAGCARPVVEAPKNETTDFLNGGYHEVTISDFHYSPQSLVVYQGDRVKWINEMPFIKSVWVWGEPASPVIVQGKSWSFIFVETGFFKVRDQYAQDMEMNITVLPYEERSDVKARLETSS